MIKRVFGFVKEWMLIFAMLSGIGGYFLYAGLPLSAEARAVGTGVVNLLQPLLIFAMLFLTFCKVNPKHLRLCPWHGRLLLFQTGCFSALGAVLIILPHSGMRVVLEGMMICLICPTATAGAVVTKKLNGNAAHLTTYTILINLCTAFLVPALVPYIHPMPGLSVWSASLLILGKVFPLLLLPLLAAILIRYLAPKLHFVLSHYQDLAFYMWAVALALSTAVTVRCIVHSDESVGTMLWLVVASLLCCLVQFYVGRRTGGRYNDLISAGQSLGQKNTVLSIWMGFMFFTPVTAVVGGFYSVWQNIINSWQLHKQSVKQAAVCIAVAFGGLCGLGGFAGLASPLCAQSAYQQKVWHYRPAPGQFIDASLLAETDEEAAQVNEEKICRFLTEKMAGVAGGRLLSLGSYGGYVVFGFDHRIPNGEGLDLRLYGNAFYSAGHGADSPTPGGSAEPGIVYVSRDDNHDGLPNDTWYEIRGSETLKPSTVADYCITYYRPTPLHGNVFWRDNQGDSGYVYRNTFHVQDSYYPWWIAGDSLVFCGRRLRDNAVNEDTLGNGAWFLQAFDYGYADNHPNSSKGAMIDLDWAIDAAGNAVKLDGIDFVKIMTGVRQNIGWAGEISTEVSGVEDIHCLTDNEAATSGGTADARNLWSVYPNPCTGATFYVEGPSAQVRLYNAQGRCVGRREIEASASSAASAADLGRTAWPTAGLKSGLYLIEVRATAAASPAADANQNASTASPAVAHTWIQPVYYKLLIP